MNRRDFIRSLSAAFVAALVPWKLPAKANPVDSIVIDWRDSLKTPAMGGPAPAGFPWWDLGEGHEFFVPYDSGKTIFSPDIKWSCPTQPITLGHYQGFEIRTKPVSGEQTTGTITIDENDITF